MKTLKILPFLLAILTFFGICAAHSKNNQIDTNARQKARYYYIEASTKEADEKADAAYELYRRSWQSDPNYEEGASAYGLRRLFVDLDTLQSNFELMRSLNLARTLIEKYPDDVENVEYYAFIAQALDTIEESERVLARLDSLSSNSADGFLRMAAAYAQRGEFKKALKALNSYERKSEPNDQISVWKITWLLLDTDTVGALSEAQRLIDTDPQNTQYITIKGDLYEAIGQKDSAMALYNRAEKLDPSSAAVKMAIANLYLSMNDSVNYDNKIYEALLTEDMEMEMKIKMVASYLQRLITDKSDTKRGDELFSVLQKQYPHEAPVLDLAARYDAAKGNFSKAIEEIKYALDQDMQNADYWGQLMTYLIQDDRNKEAMLQYKSSIEHVGNNPGIELLYATAALMDKQYDIVVNTYTRMIHDLTPQANIRDSIDISQLQTLSYEQVNMLSNYYSSLGDAFFAMADTTAAYQCYDNSLMLVPDNALTLNNYAYFLAESNQDLERAETMSEKSLNYDPENITYMDTYAWILFKKQDYKKALDIQRAAIEAAQNNDDSSADLFLHYGDILFMNGRPDEALENWKKALELDNDSLSDQQRDLLKKKIKHKAFFFK